MLAFVDTVKSRESFLSRSISIRTRSDARSLSPPHLELASSSGVYAEPTSELSFISLSSFLLLRLCWWRKRKAEPGMGALTVMPILELDCREILDAVGNKPPVEAVLPKGLLALGVACEDEEGPAPPAPKT